MVAVVGNTGIPLMPTTIKHARKLLKRGRARIYKHFPLFTIQLLERKTGNTQPIEYDCDTGYLHIGVSVASQKHEYASTQFDLLPNEPEKHRDRRVMRRQRRNRKRYRQPRFDNRKASKPKNWLAPSIQNKMDQHIRLFKAYTEILPVTSAVFEMGQFDTQLLKAIEEGKPAPEGVDYQHGDRYGIATLREAVFTRDQHQCVFCERGIKDHAVLHVHHIGFWKGDHSNKMSNLATACEKCHTPKEHKPGGKLHGVQPKLKSFRGATFMTTVRWQMLKLLKEQFPGISICITYGAKTKVKRRDLHVTKSHANDAYAMGEMHPKHRCRTMYYKKCRRNNRVLEKFYDAKYTDLRDGSKKSGQNLFSGRSKRNKSLNTENLHQYRGQKLSKGRRSIRKQRYPMRPGDIVSVKKERHRVIGTHNNGSRVMLSNGKSVAVGKTKCVYHCGGWQPLTEKKQK